MHTREGALALPAAPDTVAGFALPCVGNQVRGFVLLRATLSASHTRLFSGEMEFYPPRPAARPVLCAGLDPCTADAADPSARRGPSAATRGEALPPSPLPPQLLNLFKLGERGEEVRPFGEAT